MSMAQSPASRGKSRERSQSQTNQVPFSPEFSKMLMKSSPRFGSLSHHSFFSRHNPHPNRVKHIQGLNGRPVCMNLYGVSTNKSAAQFSEAWRDELKDLAAKVSLSPQAQKDKKDDQPEEEFVLRKTQYSAETGRIIPSSTNSYQRRPYSQRLTYPQTFHDQELMVFELLCQILQTDSLSAVQQWLLLAGQREKDLVMGMIKQAMDGADLSGHHQQNFQPLQAFHPGASPSVYGPSSHQPWRKQQRTSLYKEMQASSNDKPERIGDAEVLEVHSEAQEDLQDPLLQNSGCRDGNVGLPFHPD
ncbi:protein TBATA isoform X5 [Cyclopterus lumpus]|uniref:protein TBATA isoform X5 n=1 Tax=Cyclopterus lumpus TaxID=8103 RepID=UPI0014873E5B|nr:protein TBATA isoform X5 [Cyclopterus lumpus]